MKVIILYMFEEAARHTFNPSHPNISMHIHHTVLYMFPNFLTRRTCLTIKSFSVGDHFLCSCDLNVCLELDIVGRN